MESHTESKADADIFQRLPITILLDIFKLCPDFTTLHNLLIASRTCASVFDGDARHITEAIMAASIPAQIEAPMRAVVLIRTRTHAFRNIGDFDALLQDHRNMKPLPYIQDAALLRKFVALAHQIHVLSHACLEHYLEKCQSLKPSRPKDPQFRYSWQHPYDQWPKRPPGERYDLPILDPPVWLEEQRVAMCLWRLQGFYELQNAREKGWLDWTSKEIGDLEATSVLDLHDFKSLGARQLCLTVIEFIDILLPPKSPPPNTHHRFELPPISSASSHFSFTCSPEPHFVGNEEARMGIEWYTWALRCYMSMKTSYKSPLEHGEFTPYRKYGFAIWDKERMIKCGLLSEKRSDIILYPDPRWFIWRSILSKEEDEAVRAAQRGHM